MFLNFYFFSTVLLPPGILFQLMGPWYANARCQYDLVLAAATLGIFEYDNERSDHDGVYTLNSSDRYFGYAVVNAVWHKESIL